VPPRPYMALSDTVYGVVPKFPTRYFGDRRQPSQVSETCEGCFNQITPNLTRSPLPVDI